MNGLWTTDIINYLSSLDVFVFFWKLEYRAWIYSCTWIFWIFGTSILPIIVYLSGSWFIIGLSTSLPGIVLLLYFYHLPESPRWQLSVGNLEDCANGLMQIAKCNGNSEKFSKSQLNQALKRLHDKRDQNAAASIGVWTLFSKFRLAKNTLLLTLCW